MNIFENAAGLSRPRLVKQILAFLVSFALLFATWPRSLAADQDAQAPPPEQATEQAPPSNGQAPPYTQQTPEQLQQLVAPIALYPDSLVAQILAASTFPEQVVEADRWVQAHPDLKGDALAQAVDQQPWDPSVKALTAFPSVLGNMDKNLSWTSSLGDAYYNQQQDVTDAVQVMRQRAQAAGDLKTTPQQVVTAQGSTIVIEPADPDVVYVPAYDPWIVYGDPLLPWPGWYDYPGIWYGGPYLSLDSGSRSAFSAALDGAGVAGDSTGTTTTRFTTTTGTSLEAPRFTTVTTSTAEKRHAEDLPGAATLGALPRQQRGPSTETIGPLEDTPNHAVKVEPDRAPSAATAAAARRGAFRRAEAPASAAEGLEAADSTAAVVAVAADGGNGSSRDGSH